MKNNRWSVFLILAVLLFSLVLTGCTAANDTQSQGLWDIIKGTFQEGGILKGIFFDFSESLATGDAAGITGARILFALLIFAILFGASQIALQSYAQNIRVVICLIIGVISAIAIPGQFILDISRLWGGIFYIVMVAAPVAAGTYLIFKVFKGEERFDYFMKFMIAGVATFALTFLAGGVEGVGSFLSVAYQSFMNGISTIFTFLGLLYGVLALYFLYKFINPSGSAADRRVDWDKSPVLKWWKRRGRADFSKEPELLREIKKDIKDKKASDAKSKLKKAEKIEKRVQGVILYSWKEVVKIKDAAKKTAAETKITEIEAELQKLENNLEEVRKQVDKPSPNWTRAMTGIDAAILAHNTQMKLEIDFLKLIGISV